jgi:hypothetical protein
MSEHQAEVSAKLTLDDHATEALHKVREGFEHVHEKVQEVQHEMLSFAKQAAATAVGFNFMNGIDSIKEFGHEIINASLEAKAQEKALAGVLLLTDQTGKSMEELKEQAHGIKDEFEEIGFKFGANADELNEAFAQVAERSTKSTEQVIDFTEKMFFAGKAVSGGMQAIAGGFSMIELGNVRASNAVVKLIAAQHMLKGNARDVAKAMMKMTQHDRIELAEKAVERMADKLKPKAGADLGFKQVISAMKSIREQLFETIGNPIVEQLSKQLNRIHRYFLDNQKTIEHWALTVGEKVGDWVNTAADKIKEGFQYIQTHADEIKKAITEGFETAKSVVQFILDHKEALAIAFGAKAVAPAVGSAVNMARGAWGIGKAVQGLSGAGMAGVGMEGSAALGAGALGTAATLGLLTAAIVAVGAAGYQMYKLYNELPSKENEASTRMEAMRRNVGDGNVKFAQRMRDEVVLFDATLAEAANAMLAQTQAVAQQMAVLKAQVDATPVAETTDSIQSLMGYFNTAAGAHNAAMENYIAKIIAGNSGMLRSMDVAGDAFLKGGEELVAKIDQFNHDAATALRKLLDQTKKDAADASKPKPPNYNFNGGQTFNIKQDFRDQDPDKIALVFRQDIMRHTENRVQSRYAMGSGL